MAYRSVLAIQHNCTHSASPPVKEHKSDRSSDFHFMSKASYGHSSYINFWNSRFRNSHSAITNIVKGESNDKTEKLCFSEFGIAEPPPVFYKYSEYFCNISIPFIIIP